MNRYLLVLAAVLLLAGCSSDDGNPAGNTVDPVEEAIYQASVQEVLRMAGPAHTSLNPLQGLWLNEMSTGTWLISDRVFAWYPIGYSPFETYAIFISATHRAGDSVWVHGLLRDHSVTASLTGLIDDSTMTCTAQFVFADSSTEHEAFTLKLTDPENAQR